MSDLNEVRQKLEAVHDEARYSLGQAYDAYTCNVAYPILRNGIEHVCQVLTEVLASWPPVPVQSDLEEAIAAIDAAQAAGMVEWADIILVWRDKSGARGAQPFTSASSMAETCIAAAAWLRERHHKPEVQAMDRDACEAELEAAVAAGNIGAWGKVHHRGTGWNAWTSPGLTHDADSELAALRTVVAALREHKHGGAE